jgi:hypothetical protein
VSGWLGGQPGVGEYDGAVADDRVDHAVEPPRLVVHGDGVTAGQGVTTLIFGGGPRKDGERLTSAYVHEDHFEATNEGVHCRSPVS